MMNPVYRNTSLSTYVNLIFACTIDKDKIEVIDIFCNCMCFQESCHRMETLTYFSGTYINWVWLSDMTNTELKMYIYTIQTSFSPNP